MPLSAIEIEKVSDPLRLADLSDLRGKVAFVTGSGSGIGRASSLRLAEAGACVCGYDLDPVLARETAEMLGVDGSMSLQGDVTDRDDVQRAVNAVVEEHGRLDVVVNSAGIFPPKAVLDLDGPLWDKVMGVNATGTFIVAQTCARRMRDLESGGSIVNVASKSAFQPTRGFAHYAASKGAVKMMTRALALELAPFGIRVNAVAPGSVTTPGSGRAGEGLDEQLVEDARSRSTRCPMGRSASPDEIARVILFLATDWSSFMTGSVVVADGGFLVS